MSSTAQIACPLDAFQPDALIARDRNHVLVHAWRVGDNKAVWLKYASPAKESAAGPETAAELRREAEIALALQGRGALALRSLHETTTGPLLEFEAFAGPTLKEARSDGLVGHKGDLSGFLRVAQGIAEAVAALHAQRFIHKRLSPEALYVDAESGAARLGNLGRADRMQGKARELADLPQEVSGLAYIAPEQTGRLNWAVGFGCDLYALGVIFYELLTGQLLFEANDVLEWVHCHLARTPVPPSRLNASVPPILDAIVLKLLAKNPSDRYASASGLLADLRRVENTVRETGAATDFALGEADTSQEFQLPDRLYGRAAEHARLSAAFDRVRGGTNQLLTITGPPGAGKSSLVYEWQSSMELREFLDQNSPHHAIGDTHVIADTAAQRRVLFAAGKFERSQRDQPYFGLRQALQGVCRAVDCEPAERRAAWQARLQAALGRVGRVMTDAFPGLLSIVGEQPPVLSLPPAEARNRFNEAFRKLIAALAGSGTPLVFFLDDIQWADRSSLALLESLLTAPEGGGLLLILGYRTNDPVDLEIVEHALTELGSHGLAWQSIAVEPLTVPDLCAMLADTMGGSQTPFEPLAEVLREKTGGNPFFVRQFLLQLAEEETIFYSEGWHWDELAIRQADVTDNVVAFVAGRIGRLAPSWREMIETCSCFGSRIRRDLLPELVGRSEEEVQAALEGAVASGALLLRGAEYSFVHDRVREAATLLLPAERLAAIHRQIADTLLQQTDAQVEQDIFDIVYHLAAAKPLRVELDLRSRTHVLNLRAARRARNAAAYGPALEYARGACPGFADELWQSEYELCANAALMLSECLFFNQQIEEFERFNDALLARLVASEHIVPLRRMMVLALSAGSRHREAVARTEEALEYLGSPIPAEPAATMTALGEETARIHSLIATKGGIEALRALPSLADARVEAIIGILLAITPDTLMLGLGALYALAVARAVRLSIEHGYSALFPVVAANYSVVMQQSTGDVETAYRWSRLAAAADEEHGGAFHAPANFIPSWLVNCWKVPVSTQIAVMEDASRIGLEQGDILFGCFSAAGVAVFTAWSGTTLAQTVRTAERTRAIIHDRVYSAAYHCLLERQFARALMGLTQGRTSLADAELPLAELDAVRATRSAHQVGYYFIASLRLAYLFGEWEDAARWGVELVPFVAGLAGLTAQADYAVYHALTLLELAERKAAQNGEAAEVLLAEVEGQLARLRVWARDCPENFLAYQLIVEAELARLQGRLGEASALLARAVATADAARLVHHSALACELAIRVHLRSGDRVAARAYLQEALQRYEAWGAATKVQDLVERFPELRSPVATQTPSAADGRLGARSLDLLSLMKAAEAISGEIVMKRLVDRMMRTLIENACAEWGALILLEAGALVLKAVQRSTDTAEIELLNQPVQQLSGGLDILPRSLLQYVASMQEPVVLADGRRAPEFAADPVLQRTQSRSVLCAPILHKGSLSGLIYLENNLSTGVFTPERLEFLSLLSSQIAVSLDNARYHERSIEWERLQSDLDSARAIQLSLLPQKMPDSPAYQLAIRSSACYEVGGDYTDVLADSPDEWTMVVADVAGKGLASAMVASAFRAAFRAIAGTGIPLHEMAGRLGALHWSEGSEARRRYVTAAFLRLNHRSHMLEVVNAGHNPVLVVYPDGRRRLFGASAPPLGMLPGLRYRTECVEFPAGARLLAFTDGLTEVFRGDEEFGEDRLFSAFGSLPVGAGKEALESIWQALSAFSSEPHQRDDMTALTLCRFPAPVAAA